MKHDVGHVVHAAISEQEFQETYWPMVRAVRRLIDACEASGDVGPGTDAEDFLLLLSSLLRIPTGPGTEARTTRLLALIFRGLGAP